MYSFQKQALFENIMFVLYPCIVIIYIFLLILLLIFYIIAYTILENFIYEIINSIRTTRATSGSALAEASLEKCSFCLDIAIIALVCLRISNIFMCNDEVLAAHRTKSHFCCTNGRFCRAWSYVIYVHRAHLYSAYNNCIRHTL